MNRVMRALAMVWVLVCLTSACVSQQANTSEVQLDVAAEANTQLAIDYMVKGNLPAAKEKIDRALEQNPRNARAHAIAGLLYDRLGESSKADSFFQRSMSLESNPETMNNYAAFLCKNGRYDRGEKYALQAGGNPLYKTPERAYMNAGICQRQAGNLARAEEHYRRALKIRPTFGGALFEMAELELQQANFMPARAFLERYLEEGKTSPATLWLGVRIERGLGNKTGANNYAARLKNEYPTAVETKELLESERSMK